MRELPREPLQHVPGTWARAGGLTENVKCREVLMSLVSKEEFTKNPKPGNRATEQKSCLSQS